MNGFRCALLAAILFVPPAAGTDDPILLEGHIAGVRAIAFSPDGSALASGGYDGSVRIWSVKDRRTTHVLMPGGEVRHLAYSADGKYLAASNSLGVVRVWLARFGTEKRKIQAAPGRLPSIMGLGFFADGQTLGVGLADGSVKVFDAASGRLLRTLTDSERTRLSTFAVPPQADAPLIGTPAQKLHLLDPQSGAVAETMDVPEDFPGTVACSREGGRAAAAAGVSIRLYRIGGAVPSTSLSGHAGPVESIDFDRGGTWLVSCARDRTIRLWDVAGGEELWKRYLVDATPLSVALSPDGKWIATGDSAGRIRAWRLKGIPRDH